MKAHEFVNAMRSEVQDAATNDVIALLIRPPGRKPAPELVALSQWFNALPEEDKIRVREVVAMASHTATFGALTVIDGHRVIEEGADRGYLELRYIRNGETTLLNSPEEPILHELL